MNVKCKKSTRSPESTISLKRRRNPIDPGILGQVKATLSLDILLLILFNVQQNQFLQCQITKVDRGTKQHQANRQTKPALVTLYDYVSGCKEDIWLGKGGRKFPRMVLEASASYVHRTLLTLDHFALLCILFITLSITAYNRIPPDTRGILSFESLGTWTDVDLNQSNVHRIIVQSERPTKMTESDGFAREIWLEDRLVNAQKYREDVKEKKPKNSTTAKWATAMRQTSSNKGTRFHCVKNKSKGTGGKEHQDNKP